jgi:conjugal transfer/entry exclusion protein
MMCTGWASLRRLALPGMAVLWITVVPASVTPAQAWTFHDGPAFAQRIAQLAQVLAQWNQIIRSSGEQLMTLKAAYLGLKDWRNYGWIDVLRVAESPWFDHVQGIDDIRKVADLTIMDAEQAQQLFDHADFYNKMLLNPRYEKDAWYRAKVNSLLRQGKRSQAVKSALLSQFKAENKDLIEDVKKIKRIKTEIQAANQATTVDVSTITSLQAELEATQARFEGNSLILKNQQAIMFLMGDNDAQRAFEDVISRSWVWDNTRALRQLGAQFARRR